MAIVFCMIASSNTLFLMLLIQQILFRRLFNFQLQNTLLKICLSFLFFPLPLIVILLRIVLFYIFGNNQVFFIRGEDPLLVFAPNGILLNPSADRTVMIISLWFFIAAMIAAYRIFSYLKFQKAVMKSVEMFADEQVETLFHETKCLLNITTPVRLYKSSYLHLAFTTGIQNPLIIVPTEIDYSDLELVFIHELTHIQKKDVFFRIICSICTTLYWFNPLIYGIAHTYDRISELACDESVIQSINPEKRKNYACLILESAEYGNPTAAHYLNFFNDKLFFEERFDYIMKKDKFITKKVYSTVIAGLMVILSCFPALAAPMPQMLYFHNSMSGAEVDRNADIEILADGTESKFSVPAPVILYDEQIILSSGEIIPADNPDPAERAICNHTYEHVTYMTHEKNSTGGCHIEEYSADRCSKCGDLINKSLIMDYNYVTCPH